jgi:hypothetical protein
MVYQRLITVGVLCSTCVGAFAAPKEDHFTADVSWESIFTDNAKLLLLKSTSNKIH